MKPKNIILLLDECQFATPKDISNAYRLYELGYFRSILLVAPQMKDVKLDSDVKKSIKGNCFKLGMVNKNQAMKLVKSRLGNNKLLPQPVVTMIYNKSHNQRSFLEYCEDSCRHAVTNGRKKVTRTDVKAAVA